jgi:hypothetical protein
MRKIRHAANQFVMLSVVRLVGWLRVLKVGVALTYQNKYQTYFACFLFCIHS